MQLGIHVYVARCMYTGGTYTYRINHTRYNYQWLSKSNLNSVRELSQSPPPDCIPRMYNILDRSYSLGSWVRGGTEFPKGILSPGPKIAPDRIPYDTCMRVAIGVH